MPNRDIETMTAPSRKPKPKLRLVKTVGESPYPLPNDPSDLSRGEALMMLAAETPWEALLLSERIASFMTYQDANIDMSYDTAATLQDGQVSWNELLEFMSTKFGQDWTEDNIYLLFQPSQWPHRRK